MGRAIESGHSNIRSLHSALLDVFFPVSCAHCGDAVEDSGFAHFCRSCARELYLATPPACNTCGFPFFGVLAGPMSCPHCAELDPVFDEGKTLFLAKGPGRTLIHELKYHSGSFILEDIAQVLEMSPEACDYLAGSVLVPVPLHPTKERERGYNQSERIARFLALQTDDSIVQKLLRRVEYTQTQTKLNRSERHRNVKNAFAMAVDAVVNPEKQYILVDDVFTTGSTLNACAAVLREAGAHQIKVLTLGHG